MLGTFKKYVIAHFPESKQTLLNGNSTINELGMCRFTLHNNLPLTFFEELASFEELKLTKSTPVLTLEAQPALQEEQIFIRGKFNSGGKEYQGGVIANMSASIGHVKKLLLQHIIPQVKNFDYFILKRPLKKNKWYTYDDEKVTVRDVSLSHGVLLTLERAPGTSFVVEGLDPAPETLKIDFLLRELAINSDHTTQIVRPLTTPNDNDLNNDRLTSSPATSTSNDIPPLCPFRVALQELIVTIRLEFEPLNTLDAAAQMLAEMDSIGSLAHQLYDNLESKEDQNDSKLLLDPARIRFSILNADLQPGSIIRNKSGTFKKHKIKSETKILVEILPPVAPPAEATTSDAVTVFIARRKYHLIATCNETVPIDKNPLNEIKEKEIIEEDTKKYIGSYTGYIEVVLNKQEIKSFGNLVAKLSVLTDINVEEMEVGVYQANLFQWQRLKKTNNQQSFRRKKKKRKRQRRIQQQQNQGSYIQKFKDRTVIAVIDKVDWTGMGPAHMKEDWDDFKSDYDRCMFPLLEKTRKDNEIADLYIDIGDFGDTSSDD